MSLMCLDLKLVCSAEVVAKPYIEKMSLYIITLMVGKEIHRTTLFASLSSIGAHANDQNRHMRDFWKSLTNQAYIWYANLNQDLRMIQST